MASKRLTSSLNASSWLLVLFYIALDVGSIYSFSVTFATAMTPSVFEYVGGQRVLWTPSAASEGEGLDQPNPTMVILGGMAQSIASWEHHVPALSKSRSVLLYEARGQGAPVPLQQQKQSQEDFLKDVSLPAQASYLMNTLDKLNIITEQQERVDLVGFSLGGRIAMATALLYPDRVRKIHLTGVAADRSPLGHLTVASWKDHVASASEPSSSSSLRSFSWSVLLATYAPSTLESWQRQGKLSSILDFVSSQNTPEGLAALLEQTHANSRIDSEAQLKDEWSTMAMARRLAHQQTLLHGHACSGSLDENMAPVPEVEALCQVLGWEEAPTLLEGCGHAAPMEQPRLWRNHVLSFLDE